MLTVVANNQLAASVETVPFGALVPVDEFVPEVASG